MKLTKNFDSEEFECRCPCKRADMDLEFMTELQGLRDAFNRPMIITSGFRCPEYNQAIGGVKNSYHVKGRAADIACSKAVDRFRLIELAIACGFCGIGVYSDFIHVDNRKILKSMWVSEPSSERKE